MASSNGDKFVVGGETLTVKPPATLQGSMLGLNTVSEQGAVINKNDVSPTCTNSTDYGRVTNNTAPTRRMPHLHKLEKKHSCGDLHSRLKTRKLLGVGETDDGDVHRSKLSQILGHSDQLYIQLPGGLRAWQIVLAAIFSVMSVWAFVFPSNYFMFMFETDASSFTLPIRLYAAALISLSVIYWFTVQASDRDTIRLALLASVVFFSLQILVTLLSQLSGEVPTTRWKMCLMATYTFCALTCYYFYYVGMPSRPLGGMRRTQSSKELTDKDM